MSRSQFTFRKLAVMLGVLSLWSVPSASANVITDWDEKAIGFSPAIPSGIHDLAMVHVAMFDAVNSIEGRYRPFLARLPASPATSKEAAAASAAAGVLAGLPGRDAGTVKAALSEYLKAIPNGAGKDEGIKLGEAVAAKVLAARADDGIDAPDAYRPLTKPGAYVPTAPVIASTWPSLKPFALTKASQFRPPPPVSLKSKEWASSYNEIREYGNKTSAKRTAQQAETARFWLMVGPNAYHPLARQVAIARDMSVVDTARLMALFTVAMSDALVAVFDAKYHYAFWRPVTAIRNGDIDDNESTEREPTWLPIDNTPMHPEYPCAHCTVAGAACAVIQGVTGTDQMELALTSTTAPGVTHRWSNLKAIVDEVSQARIWAGFHYRFSTVVGRELGGKVGRHVVANLMQPLK